MSYATPSSHKSNSCIGSISIASIRVMSHPTTSLHLSLIQKLATSSSSHSSHNSSSNDDDNNNNNTLLDLQRTPEQTVLQIPPIQICLAGLALLECDCGNATQDQDRDALPTNDRIHQRFLEFCRHYNSHLNTHNNPLPLLPAMSPRVMPTAEQLIGIRQHLACIAQESLETMLLEESTKTEDPARKFTHQQTKRPKHAKHRRRTDHESVVPSLHHVHPRNSSSSSSPDPISLAHLIQTRLRVLERDDQELERAENTDDEWIPIPPKLKQRLPSNRVEAQHHFHLHPTNDTKIGIITNKAVSPVLGDTSQSHDGGNCSPIRVDTFHTKTSAPTTPGLDTPTVLSRDSVHGKMIVLNSCCTSQPTNDYSATEGEPTTEASDHAAHSESLHDKVARLELALKDANDLLQHERSQHAQQLSQEKERHANSMQALQLRLYISNTRLKTYQEALEEHVQSVASNVWQPSSPISPPLSSTDSPRLASPLISRISQTFQQEHRGSMETTSGSRTH